MIYLNRFLLFALSLPGISKADDPKETSIYGSLRLPDDGDQEAAQVKRVAEVVLRHRPIQRHSLPGALLQRLAIRAVVIILHTYL
jgi:hypothetical protein